MQARTSRPAQVRQQARYRQNGGFGGGGITILLFVAIAVGFMVFL